MPKITKLTEEINKLAFVTEGSIVPYTQDEKELKNLTDLLDKRLNLVLDFHDQQPMLLHLLYKIQDYGHYYNVLAA